MIKYHWRKKNHGAKNSKNSEMANTIFNILNKNNYKAGRFYEYQYNIISLEFYSNEANCINRPQNDFIQMDVLEIGKYYSLERYLNR
jgi:hypothetical protein